MVFVRVSDIVGPVSFAYDVPVQHTVSSARALDARGGEGDDRCVSLDSTALWSLFAAFYPFVG